MSSTYIDLQVGIRKIKRAEAALLGRRPDHLPALDKPELMECAWALSTMLVAAHEGARLAPEVFALAESIAHSQSSTFAVSDTAMRAFPPGVSGSETHQSAPLSGGS